MSSETLTTSLLGQFPTTVLGAVKEAHNRVVILPRINSTILGPTEGVTGTYAVWATRTVSDITEGSAVGNTEITSASKSITVAQRGLKFSITDLAARQSAFGVSGAIENAVRQVSQDVDAKIAALFAGFTANAQETASTMTMALFYAALGKVLSATGNMAIGSADLTLALSPKSWVSFCADAAANGVALPGTSMAQNLVDGQVFNYGGVQFVATGMIPNAGTGQYSNALFYRDALGAVFAWAPRIVSQPVADTPGGPGTIISVSHASGYSELVDAFGCQIVADTV